MSMNQLGLLVDGNHGWISRLEHGTRHPRRETVDALAEALGLSGPDADRLRLAAGFAPHDMVKLVRLSLDCLMTQERGPISKRACAALLGLHDLQDLLTRHDRDLDAICREVR